MHKLIEYVCVELEKIEKQAGTGNLSISEIEYADKLAHLKKNLLRAEELMEEGYSGDVSAYPMSFRDGRYSRRGSSYDERGRSSNAQRDSRGRYSSRGGRGNYTRYMRDDYSMDSGEVIEDLRDIMNQAPDERLRQEIKRIITKVEQMDD